MNHFSYEDDRVSDIFFFLHVTISPFYAIQPSRYISLFFSEAMYVTYKTSQF